MNIIVLIKQVPDTSEIKIDPETNRLMRAGVPSIINPVDKNAIEAAVQYKEEYGGKVVVLSMGPSQAKKALKESLALGADEAYLVTDRLFGGSDTYATSYILSEAIKKIGDFDIIFAGQQAIDGDTGQTGPSTAQHLGISRLTYVVDVSLEGEDTVIVKREVEEGIEVIASKKPLLCTVTKAINKPRYATIKSILAANQAEIGEITAADLGEIDKNKIGLKGSPTRVKKTFTPDISKNGEIISADTAEEAAEKLVDKLLAKNVL